MTDHAVVSSESWLTARGELLKKEKEFTRLRDQLSAERRKLPWVRVENRYAFDGPGGMETLADLFAGRSQLIVYHFMLGPGWKEGCKGCSFVADHMDGTLVHLANRDATLAAVSRAPLGEIQTYQKRMGWQFKWVSSHGNDFNFDYHVSFKKEDLAKGKVVYNYEVSDSSGDEMPGASVFYKDVTGTIFHTYSCYARGLEMLVGTYSYLDLLPKGRDEAGLQSPMSWVRHHDRYAHSYVVDRAPSIVRPPGSHSCCGSAEEPK